MRSWHTPCPGSSGPFSRVPGWSSAYAGARSPQDISSSQGPPATPDGNRKLLVRPSPLSTHAHYRFSPHTADKRERAPHCSPLSSGPSYLRSAGRNLSGRQHPLLLVPLAVSQLRLTPNLLFSTSRSPSASTRNLLRKKEARTARFSPTAQPLIQIISCARLPKKAKKDDPPPSRPPPSSPSLPTDQPQEPVSVPS